MKKTLLAVIVAGLLVGCGGSDGGGGSSSTPPPEVNNPPEIGTEISDLVLEVSEVKTLTINASDVDGDSLTYKLSKTPVWVTIDNTKIHVAPPVGVTGEFSVTYAVFDAESSVEGTFKVTVKEPVVVPPPVDNRAPTVIDVKSVRMSWEEKKYVQIQAVDPDGDDLTYRIISAPRWASIGETGTIKLAPNKGDEGDERIEFSVSDGEFTIKKSFGVTVTRPANEVPTIESNLPENIEIFMDEVQTYNMDISDADGDELTVSIRGKADFVTVSDSGAITIAPKEGDTGMYDVFIDVKDDLDMASIYTHIEVSQNELAELEKLAVDLNTDVETLQEMLDSFGIDFFYEGDNPILKSRAFEYDVFNKMVTVRLSKRDLHLDDVTIAELSHVALGKITEFSLLPSEEKRYVPVRFSYNINTLDQLFANNSELNAVIQNHNGDVGNASATFVYNGANDETKQHRIMQRLIQQFADFDPEFVAAARNLGFSDEEISSMCLPEDKDSEFTSCAVNEDDDAVVVVGFPEEKVESTSYNRGYHHSFVMNLNQKFMEWRMEHDVQLKDDAWEMVDKDNVYNKCALSGNFKEYYLPETFEKVVTKQTYQDKAVCRASNEELTKAEYSYLLSNMSYLTYENFNEVILELKGTSVESIVLGYRGFFSGYFFANEEYAGRSTYIKNLQKVVEKTWK